MLKDLIHPGDKADIRLQQQMGQVSAETVPIPRVYQSVVVQARENGNLELEMPMEEEHVVLLPPDSRLELVLYSKTEIYRILACIRERYQKNNTCIFEVEVKSSPEILRRREYQRYVCEVPVEYYAISEDSFLLGDLSGCISQDSESGVMIDISGGGLCFSSQKTVKLGDYLLVCFLLPEQEDRFHITGRIVGLEEMGQKQKIHFSFSFPEKEMQEKLVRALFLHERREA